MKLDFRRFDQAHYPVYKAWFADPELDRRLGPMNQEWLDYVLAGQETEGITWAVYRDAEFVAVLETVFDPQQQLPAAITAIAVRPNLRGQGIGTAVLQQILALHRGQGIDDHVLYIAQDHTSARRLVERAGFVQTAAAPNEYGYLEFRCHNQLD
ncbi:MAG: GNAT family N-acetyltransferase [Caldilineaceae bacterium]